ncbi:MAG: 23S rRNA (pseudouridine(1915)-N(3))-methyltransferase RlmH [Rhodospirillales bacterium]|nr:23S rRNA (pseudouridine(1915)-N(3))-methyltransferase RlmH [Rhodospirillales bacterium]
MNITIAAVGRLKSSPEKDLWDDYARRLTWPVKLKEVGEKKSLPPKQMREKEGKLLLATLPAGATVIALDQLGKSLSSNQFAERFQLWMTDGIRDVAFLLGGSDGLSPDALARAHLRMSMGAQTWPHMLARCMLLEQIYRAQCILGNHPYHK